jgi:hypothetical protein
MEKLEPAARAVVEADRVKQHSDDMVVWDAIEALAVVVAELDAYDERVAARKERATLWRALDRAVTASMPVTKVAGPIGACGYSHYGPCGLTAGWESAAGPNRCKRHAEKQRDAYVSQAIKAAYRDVTGDEIRWGTMGADVPVETSRAIAEKLGVALQ